MHISHLANTFFHIMIFLKKFYHYISYGAPLRQILLTIPSTKLTFHFMKSIQTFSVTKLTLHFTQLSYVL